MLDTRTGSKLVYGAYKHNVIYMNDTLCRETIKCGLLSVCYTLQGDN